MEITRTIKIDDDTWRVFTGWLEDHEADIAGNVNDFGDLRGLFEQVAGWIPMGK